MGREPEWWPVPSISINVLLQIVRNRLKIAAVLEVIKGSTRTGQNGRHKSLSGLCQEENPV